jgi:hypothetical protein
LTQILRDHIENYGTGSDGRLFSGVHNNGRLGSSMYGRVRAKARAATFAPDVVNSPLAKRPYDLRHACVSSGSPRGWSRPESPPGRATAWPSCSANTPSSSTTAKRTPAPGWSAYPAYRNQGRNRAQPTVGHRTRLDTVGQQANSPVTCSYRSPGLFVLYVAGEGFEPPKLSRLIYSQLPLATRAARLCG